MNLKYLDHSDITRCLNDLLVYFPRVNTTKINYKYQSVKMWNDLPNELICTSYLETLKRQLTL